MQKLRPATTITAPDAVATDRRDLLLLLQVGRGLAAIGVAISHARLGTSAFVEPIPGWLMTILENGSLGVDFFFVLSGFVILNSHLDDESSLHALKSYIFKRISRIYIPYWPVCAIVIAGDLLVPSLSNVNRDWDGRCCSNRVFAIGFQIRWLAWETHPTQFICCTIPRSR